MRWNKQNPRFEYQLLYHPVYRTLLTDMHIRITYKSIFDAFIHHLNLLKLIYSYTPTALTFHSILETYFINLIFRTNRFHIINVKHISCFLYFLEYSHICTSINTYVFQKFRFRRLHTDSYICKQYSYFFFTQCKVERFFLNFS